MSRHGICRALSMLGLFAALLLAQSDRGVIIGTVTDKARAVVPGASILAIHIDTKLEYKASTGESGEFVLPSLPVGAYRVTVEQTGFKTAVHARVQVESGSSARIDTILDVGDVQQSIEVSAQSTQLQTDNAKVTNSISNKMIDSLPTVVSG